MKIQNKPSEGFFNTRLLGLDLETTSFYDGISDPFRDKVLLISLANNEGQTLVLRPGPWLEELWGALRKADLTTIIHNATFDLPFLWELGFEGVPANVWDSMHVERLFTAGLHSSAGLATVAWNRLQVRLDKDIRDSFANHTSLEFSDEQIKYAGLDAEVLVPIMRQQWVQAKSSNLLETAKLENSLVPVVAKMEYVGVGFDTDLWETVRRNEQEQANTANQKAQMLLPVSGYHTNLFDNSIQGVNLNSPIVLRDALNRIGINVPSTGKNILQKHLVYNPEDIIMRHILDYRTHIKRSGFNYDGYIHPVTGRIHTDFNQTGTTTGRFSSSDPNVQNIPRLAEYRQLFTALPGWMMVKADYGQQEMRVLAEMSGDKNLIEVCMSTDIHAENAKRIFGVDEPTMAQRFIAKNCGFAIGYGAGAEKVAMMANIPLYQADLVVTYVRSQFPQVDEWAREMVRMVDEVGYVTTIGGRRRNFQAVGSDEYWNNQIRNSPIQGTSADMMKRAIVYIDSALSDESLDARIVLTVHDEVVVETPEREVSTVDGIVRREMLRAGEYYVKSVPMVTDTVVAPYWKK